MSERALQLLGDLVAHPTIAGHSDEALIAELAQRLTDAGARVQIVASERADGLNLHAVLGPTDAPGGILLAAHCDVVDVAGQPWTRDPFTLHVDGGRAYGRGTADMKGFLAAALTVGESLDAARLRRPVHLAVSCDEEIGCRGVPALLESLAQLPVGPAWALIGEPTGLRVVDRHKGKAMARIELHGRAAHSSVPADGVNAVAHMGRLITGLTALADELTLGPLDDAFRAAHCTVGIGPVNGGVAVNIVPEHCTLEVELRTIPAIDPDALMGGVHALAEQTGERMRAEHPDCEVTVRRLGGYPALAPADADATAPVAAALSAALAGVAEEAPWGVVDFGTEAGLYAQALGIPAVVCGPGSIRDAHRADESIALDELDRAEAMLARLCAPAPER